MPRALPTDPIGKELHLNLCLNNTYIIKELWDALSRILAEDLKLKLIF